MLSLTVVAGTLVAEVVGLDAGVLLGVGGTRFRVAGFDAGMLLGVGGTAFGVAGGFPEVV